MIPELKSRLVFLCMDWDVKLFIGSFPTFESQDSPKKDAALKLIDFGLSIALDEAGT